MDQVSEMQVPLEMYLLQQRKAWAEEHIKEAKINEANVYEAMVQLGALTWQERQLFQQRTEAAKLKADIENEVVLRELDRGKDGKINGSNQAIRDVQTAALLSSLRKQGEYADICDQADALDREYNRVKSEIDLNEKALSAHLTLLRLATAKISALGG